MTHRLIAALANWRCARCDTWNGPTDAVCIVCAGH